MWGADLSSGRAATKLTTRAVVYPRALHLLLPTVTHAPDVFGDRFELVWRKDLSEPWHRPLPLCDDIKELLICRPADPVLIGEIGWPRVERRRSWAIAFPSLAVACDALPMVGFFTARGARGPLFRSCDGV